MVRRKNLNGFVLSTCATGTRHFVGQYNRNLGIVTGKDCETSYQAVTGVLINYYFYDTKQYVKVYNILVYLRDQLL